MKELLFFPLQIICFASAFFALRALLSYWNIPGLASLLIFSLPVIAFIAFATHDKPKDRIKSFGAIAFWFYSVLLACLGIAVLA